jgi:hypothetical protein
MHLAPLFSPAPDAGVADGQARQIALLLLALFVVLLPRSSCGRTPEGAASGAAQQILTPIEERYYYYDTTARGGRSKYCNYESIR